MDDFLWWRDGIIYQIYPRSFADSDGDGLGDLPGITGRLDTLQALGVDAIWLSPIYPSPDADFGYDVSDYTAVDPRFGTLADFDALVSAAHARGIRVVLDQVLNHTSDQHPWFQESRADRASPKRDWYLWRDPAPGGGRPNNWQSVFGGPGWQWDAATGQYYFHIFVPQQPDLNWRNPAVEAAVFDSLHFWLERGVDGFRLDVFNAYYKHAGLPDNPPALGLRGWDRQRHVYDIDQPEMFPLLTRIRALMDAYPERYAVGETFEDTPEKAAGYAGEQLLHQTFNFRFARSPWLAASFRREIGRWEALLARRAWPCYALSNHDVPRAATRYARDHDDRRLKAAAVLLLTVRGTPYLYYGEEIGMRDIRLKRSEILDPPGRRFWPFYKGRDGCRSPMQWDDSPNAGFAPAGARPWLPVHPGYRTRSLAAQQAAPDSLWCAYQALIALRRASPALTRGALALLPAPPGVLAYRRDHADQTAWIAINFSPGAQTMRLPAHAGARARALAYTTDPANRIDASGEVTLAGESALIVLD